MIEYPTLALAAIVAAIVWAGDHVGKVVHAAYMDRRDDHKEMRQVLEAMADHLSKVEAAVEGLSNRFDPPDLSEYE